MSEKEEKTEYRRPYPSLVWPVILVTAGVLLLLSNMGMLAIDWWNLWRLWPVLLILGGLEIILGRRSALGNLVVLIVTVVVIGGVVLLLIGAPEVLGGRQAAGDMRFSEPLDGVERVDLEIAAAAGQLNVGALSDSADLITGKLDLATSRQPVWEITRSGDTAQAVLHYPSGISFNGFGRGDDWEIDLAPKVTYQMDISLGAGEAVLDLSSLKVDSLNVEAGAGQAIVTLPKESGLSGRLTGGVGQLVIKVPANMAVRVQVDRGLGGVSLPDRFEKVSEDVYQTDNWSNSETRLDLQVEVGVGAVTIRDF